MKPMGRRPKRFPGKVDCHPRGPLVNWWEAEMGTDGRKKTERARAKKEIENQLYTQELEK